MPLTFCANARSTCQRINVASRMVQVAADADENLPSGHESYKVNKGKQMDMQNKHVECVWSFKRREESTRRML